MTEKKTFNLFVYGTLMEPTVFRSVLGVRIVTNPAQTDEVDTFWAQKAVLNGYKKISPDNTYLYAVPDKGHRISGYMVHRLPKSCLQPLMVYEGRNYSRRTLKVQTSDGREKAIVFVGKVKELEHTFGHPFRDKLKQEILLEKKIDEAIRKTEEQLLHTNEKLTRRAVAELSGTKIRDIMRRHFEAGGISDYTIRHTLQDRPLPDYDRVKDSPAVIALAPNYLRMVIRQVIFNQFEERIRKEFRYELDHLPQAETFYERIISSLLALRILNQNSSVLDMIVNDCLERLDFQSSQLVDYVKKAISDTDTIYDPRVIKANLDFIRWHMGFGHIPLGAELEFSNIGHDVIRDPQGQAIVDPVYDGFLYFKDFGLDALTWKLGGHIDNHREKTHGKARRGFFEVALGNLSIEANISKPITRDPWILNQLIHQTRLFYDITPHSIHLSMQLRSQHRPDRDRLLPMYVLKCLFAIAGDPIRDEEGNFKIGRITSGEILQQRPQPTLLFSEISKRFSSHNSGTYMPGVGEGLFVQQFRFLRLSKRINYEPIVMGLKGIQISLRPGTFMRGRQWEESKKHRQFFEELLNWGQNPAALHQHDIDRFLAHVEDGLLSEKRGKPAHNHAYIQWSIDQLADKLNAFNATLNQPPKAQKKEQA